MCFLKKISKTAVELKKKKLNNPVLRKMFMKHLSLRIK